MQSMILGRKPGDNITIMNTLFWRGMNPSGTRMEEYLTIIYKDADTGMKYREEMINPLYTFYKAKPGCTVGYNRLFISEEDAEPITVRYKDLEKEIASEVNLKPFFYDNIASNNRRENKKLHLHPDIFNSDMNIEDYYMHEFSRMYKNEPGPITKSFFDIEVDGINALSDFPEPGECPVNAISLILQEQKKVFVFLLRNPANPLIAEFEQEVMSGNIFKELRDFIIQAVGGPEVATAYNIVDFNYNFMFYDPQDEINLIRDLFVAINTFKPDFALAWNMGFDVPYIIARIQRLGYDPADIMCSKDFRNKIATYYVDERNKSDFAERGDFAQIASYTTFLDQMIHFASRRKGQNKFHSFTLDFIGERVAKVRKLDYKHITTNISELPYKDYKTFVFYNIMDTIVQYCIEFNTADLDYVYTKSNSNCTRYCKTHRQTVYLTNRVTKEFRRDGFIVGNNCNKFNPKPDTKFPGAFVADPEQLSSFALIKRFGKAILCLDNLDDFDFSSLYPSIIREFNIAPNTQIGMLMILGIEFTHEEMVRANNTVAGAFMEDIQSQMWLEFATRWFNLADFCTLTSEVADFFINVMNPITCLTKYDSTGAINPMTSVDKKLINSPMTFYDRDEMDDPIYCIQDTFASPPDINKLKERLEQYATTVPTQRF